jgi:kynurenine formamidase
MSRIVDLSAPIAPSAPGAPVFQRNEVAYYDHAAGAAEVREMFGVPARLLRDGEGWTREVVSLGTHNSTHVDAPYHYNSQIAGRPAATIDELPLERFFGPGVVLEFADRADGEAVDVDDVQSALASIPHTLTPGDIVLIRTGRDKLYGQDDYMHHGPGVTAAATKWMYDQGVRVMGIDAWGWDRPLRMQAAEAPERDEAGIFWEAHQADLDYSQIERLVNLDQLPATGFMVACFPLPIRRASASPARVVAIFQD